jgi:FkbM family methyltransferase
VPELFWQAWGDLTSFQFIDRHWMWLMSNGKKLAEQFVGSIRSVLALGGVPKGEPLRPAEAALLKCADHYDLTDSSERVRSVAELERLFFRLCAMAQSELFIEAGAKTAAASIRARRSLPTARIAAFEANPYTYDRYHARVGIAASNVEFHHLALANSNRQLAFHVQLHNGQPSADGQGSVLKRLKPKEGQTKVLVDAVRLDTFFDPGDFKTISMWIDVEGANREVMEGAQKLLPLTDVMFVEVENKRFWEKQWLSTDVVEFLADFAIRPVARDFQSRTQFNYIFVSDRLAALAQTSSAIAAYVAKAQAASLRASI